jgi:hypothetical protein
MATRRRRHAMKCVECGGAFESARDDARYCSPACRKRGSRAGRVVRDQPPSPSKPPAPPTGGVLRRGLEDWLVERPGMPEAVVAQARVLADQLDAAPDDSPLHGRYSAVLSQLSAAAAASGEFSVAELQRELFGGV